MGVGSCRLTYFAAEMQKLANIRLMSMEDMAARSAPTAIFARRVGIGVNPQNPMTS
jgi:hypothetical protein